MIEARLLPIALLLATALCACVSRAPGVPSYPGRANHSAYAVQLGRIVAVESVVLEGRPGVVGTVGGAAVGRAAGRTLVDGSDRALAGAVGGVAGAVAGRSVEKALATEPGQELTVELDNGQVIVVVQDLEERFAVGERVRVLRGRGSTRVRPV